MRNLLKMFPTPLDISKDVFEKAVAEGKIEAFTSDQVMEMAKGIIDIRKAVDEDLSNTEKQSEFEKAKTDLSRLVKKRIVNEDGSGRFMYLRTVETPETITE